MTQSTLAYDTFMDTERLRSLLAESQGEGVGVCILDTGVDSEHPALAGCVDGTYEVVRSGMRMSCQPCAPGDAVGHGTACAGIIHEIAPAAKLVSVRVIGSDASGTLDQLLFGLDWAVKQDFKIINLSLGTVQRRMLVELHSIVDRAYFEQKIIVAAANNRRILSYPAHFASLIAVDNNSYPDRMNFDYVLGRPVEVVANGIYVRAPSPGGQYRLFTGTSFACPHVSGILARLASRVPDLTTFQAKSLLWALRSNEDGKVPARGKG